MKKEKKAEHSWSVIRILFWLFVKWKLVKKKSLFEFKKVFPVSYYEIWRKPLTEDFILDLLIFIIILIIIFLEYWVFVE